MRRRALRFAGARSRRDPSMGVSHSAHTRLAVRVATNRPPNCLNMIPASPFKKINGTKTTIVVSVDALIAVPTSSLPNIAASRGAIPASTFVVMFSSTTTALSTTIPIAIAKLASEMMLIVQPIVHIKMIARISENGMVSAIINAERTLRRKKKAVNTTKTKAQRMVMATLPIDWVMVSLVSKI